MGTVDEYNDMFVSILQARNCLAHRNGAVGPKDVDPATGIFTLRWRFSGVHVGGIYLDLNAGLGEMIVGENGALTLEHVVKTRIYNLGEQIRLTRHDLARDLLRVHHRRGDGPEGCQGVRSGEGRRPARAAGGR